MKRKRLFIAFVLGLTSFLLLGLTACNELYGHSFSAWETVVEPTCTTFGLEKRTCACGQTEYNAKALLEHTPVTDESVAATCTTFGKTEGSHCSACGTVITAQTETQKLPHDFSAWETVVEPTCTAFGLEKRTCACGQTEYNVKDVLEHTPVTDESVNATCTTFGKTEGSHCSACGVTLVAQDIIAPIGHNCDDVTVLEEARCDADGSIRYACSNADCDYFYDESYAMPAVDGDEIFANASQYTGYIQVYDSLGYFVTEATAFVISEDGKIVTSNGKLDKAAQILFMLNGVFYDVTEVLAYSTKSHLAVLKIDANNLPYAKLCTNAPIDTEKVYSVGHPEISIHSILSGNVANANFVDGESRFIHHDTIMSSNYLGGPLLNQFGEVVGVNIGFKGNERLNMAAWIGEIDKLDYSNPVSVEEYFNLTCSPTEKIALWVLGNTNASQNNIISYLLEGSNFYYAIGHNTESKHVFAEGYWLKEDNFVLNVKVIFNNTSGTYQYQAILTNNVIKNETSGYIDAATYDENTALTYDSYYGRYWTEADLMGLYTTAVYDTLEWFSAFLESYFNDLTIETFGFTDIFNDVDEQALSKLNDFVITNGALDGNTGAYVLSGEHQFNEGFMEFSLSYSPAIESAPSSTVAKIYYYTTSGSLFVASLALNPTENGNRFDFAYAVHDGNTYVTQNEAWGYLEPNLFTDVSPLTCYEFFGMNEREDLLLMDYRPFLAYLMQLLDQSVMPSVSPELSIKDLGFWFYFG